MTDTVYARNGKIHIAYRTFGSGDLDVLLLPGTLVPMESFDEHTLSRRFVERFGSFARTIMHDRRGVGQSDSIDGDAFPDPTEAAEDLVAVVDAAGSEQFAVVAGYEAATMAIALAAAHPTRVTSIVLINGFARFAHAEDHPWGIDLGTNVNYERIVEGEQTDEDLDMLSLLAPSVASDDRFREWWDRAGRRGASPRTALLFGQMLWSVDVRELLPQVSARTMVISKTDSPIVRVEEARFLGSKIPDAVVVEIPGADCIPFVDAEDVLNEAQEFLTGTKAAITDRVLATVLFTDMVDSTRLATELGDRRWRDVLDTHDRTTQRLITRDGGRLVKQTGDGSLATFNGPGPAIRCAMAMRDALGADGIRIRAGIHTGEVEVRGDDVGGIAVHIAARVMGEAGPDEIIVSSVVPPLVVGSEIAFTDRGPRELKGVPGEWRVLSVDG